MSCLFRCSSSSCLSAFLPFFLVPSPPTLTLCSAHTGRSTGLFGTARPGAVVDAGGRTFQAEATPHTVRELGGSRVPVLDFPLPRHVIIQTLRPASRVSNTDDYG